ncbi:MAG: sugar phosphatase YfbT [Microbacteriaceae bacterium]|jgi:sugar-phosphatase|nr:sugar phosphatase YfbT [Microbacteriaceae bacterium]
MTTSITCRAVLFDMDGTLVDSTSVVERVWARFAQRFDLDLATILASSHGRRMEDSIVRFGPEGVDVATVARDLSEFEYATTDGVVAVRGAAALLSSLPADRVALVTSAGRELAHMRMDSVGIPMPTVLVGSEDVERGKPYPDPYLAAARRLGVEPAHIVVFEDADAGIRSALTAGMRVIVVGEAAGEIAFGLPRVHDYSTVRARAAVGGGRITLTLD